MNPGHFYEDNTLLSDLLPGSGGASSSQAVGGSSTTTKRQEEFGDSERPKVPRVDEPAVPEPKVKAARTEVRMIHDIEAGISDEIGLEEQWDIAPPDEDYFDDETELQRGEGEGPPQVSDEQLAYLDGEAALEEIKKLHDLKVIEPCSPDPSTIPPEQLVDTTLVNDWRFREGCWRRRCRIVAREYRDGQTNEDQYSPTSSFSSVGLLLVMAMIHNLAVTALDVKDAFLVVDQKEVMYVLIPTWIRELAQDGATHWLLKKCLPGQRNAALRWNEHFISLCTEMEFEAYAGCSTIMRRIQRDKRIYLSVHVDDIILISKPEDVDWFSQTVGRTLTMKMDGPHLQGEGGSLYYLKKKITLLAEGILIQPNNTYIPKLIALLKVSGRRKRGLPYHATLESYCPENDLESERLSGESASLFRSALGLILYVAQDRPDIQFSTKVLATYMAHPCVKALAASKHLALYLDGTSDVGILLRRCDPYDTTFDRWNEEEIVEPDYRKDRSALTLDAFSDSSWGDEKSTRKSTTAGMVFANGCLILSICRAQSTVALSSCEAELYAANSTMIECMYLYQLAQFLMGEDTFVRQRLFLDSSSAKFVVQKSGVGKLKHVAIKHMFLQQLLRQKVFTIHKIPTRVNPSDLNTKKLSVERRKLLSVLCGLYPLCSQAEDEEEILLSRRIHRNVASKLVQALQVMSISLLQGCICGDFLTGNALRGEGALQDHVPVQDHGSWNYVGGYLQRLVYYNYKVYFLVVFLVFLLVAMVLCSMYPGRRLGPQRGPHGGSGSSSSRPHREEQQGEEVTLESLHRKVALMYVTVIEGRYTPRQPVTSDGIRKTLIHLWAASQCLDDGYYFAVKDAFAYLDTDQEDRAKVLLDNMVKSHISRRGPISTGMDATGRLLLERYKGTLREAGYPVLRLEEMYGYPEALSEVEVHGHQAAGSSGDGPREGDDTDGDTVRGGGHTMVTRERSRSRDDSRALSYRDFNETASRSHDDSDMESRESRLLRYQQSTMSEVSDPEEWRSLHYGRGESSDSEEWTRRNRPRGEPMVEPTPGEEEEEAVVENVNDHHNAFDVVESHGDDLDPEGESLSEQGEGRFNVFEPEGEPRSLVARTRRGRDPATYPGLTAEEINGSQYPGVDIDLSQFSDKERMMRLLECIQARMIQAEVNNKEEMYNNLVVERIQLEDLASVASDIRPGERL